MVKLIDYNDKLDDLLNGTNPFAIITVAHLKTKASKNDPQARYSWKWTITTALYEKGFSEKDILNIYRLIDWLMILPEDLTKQFTQDLINYEGEKKMPYITSAERIGIEKGRDEGMLYDAREMLLEALDAKFPSELPADVHAMIQALNNRILLKKLHRSAIQSESINGFKKTIEELTEES
jgi:hypothetical protein